MSFLINNGEVKSSLFCFIILLMSYVFQESQAQSKLEEHINVLTSPEFKGRGYFYGGADSAANYISWSYRQIGLSAISDNFRQGFSITAFGRTSNQSSIRIGDKQYIIWKDFAIQPFHIDRNRGQFVGQHQLYPLYKNDSVFFYRDSVGTDCIVRAKLTNESQVFQTIVEGDSLADKFFGRKHTTACLTKYLQKPNMNLYPSPFMSRKLKRVAKNNTKTTLHESITVNLQRDTSNYICHNIVGQLAARAKVDSIVLISAHYDHLGQRRASYYPGANDNASGIAVMLELANKLNTAIDDGWEPSYNIVFVAFAAEEYGLLGSEYFVQSDVLDISRIKCVLNMDMVGGVGSELKDQPEALYLFKSDSAFKHCLQPLLQAVSENSGVDFVLDGNSKYLRYSDQASFINRGIPALFLFSGEDGVMHTLNDTSDKLNYKKMESLVEVLCEWIMRY